MRITDKHLDGMVDRLNELTGNPVTSYTTIDGKLKANIGNYHTYHAYSGVELHQMMNEGGGVNVISRDGCGTKRQLYTFLESLIMGLKLGEKL